eukprot:jgi/Chlat1/7267/Chrsp58S06901
MASAVLGGLTSGSFAAAIPAPQQRQPVRRRTSSPPHRGATTAHVRCSGKQARCSLSHSSSSSSSMGDTTELCLWPSETVLLPTGSGALQVHEARYRMLLHTINNAAHRGHQPARFGHMLNQQPLFDANEEACTNAEQVPSLLEGQPPAGCCAEVQSVNERSDGGIEVSFAGAQRFQVLRVLRLKPFVVARVRWLEDECLDGFDMDTDQLERDVWSTLQEVQSIRSYLHTLRPTSTPAPYLSQAVIRLAPPARAQRAILAGAQASAGGSGPGRAAGAIATWQRSRWGDDYDRYMGGANGEVRSSDPYLKFSETVGRQARQEAFSFAAANMVDAGWMERTALLHINDTAARLAWVLEAICIHLQSLRAEKSLTAALQLRLES